MSTYNIEQRLAKLEAAVEHLEKKLFPKWVLKRCQCGNASWLHGRCVACGAEQETAPPEPMSKWVSNAGPVEIAADWRPQDHEAGEEDPLKHPSKETGQFDHHEATLCGCGHGDYRNCPCEGVDFDG